MWGGEHSETETEMIIAHSHCADLCKLNNINRIKLIPFCCGCLPGNPSAGPLEVSDPTLESTVLKGLSDCCIPESHMATMEHGEHLLWGPAPGHLSVLWWMAINTITAIGLRVSLCARPLSGFCASDGSKRTSQDDKFREFSSFLKVTGAEWEASFGRITFTLQLVMAIFLQTRKS